MIYRSQYSVPFWMRGNGGVKGANRQGIGMPTWNEFAEIRRWNHATLEEGPLADTGSGIESKLDFGMPDVRIDSK
jgi:hypothetical protein